VVIQTTPTPSATPTTTPTATPIIYTIVAGDTLLAIALDHRTTVEEILALNPGARPQALQIGQQIVLPAPAPAVLAGPGATAAPLTIKIAGLGLYRTPVNGLWVAGEARNDGGLPAENVQVLITLHSANGDTLASVEAWVEPAILLPGEAGPFAAMVALVPAGDLYAATTVVGGTTLPEIGDRDRDLAVAETIVTIDEGRVQVTGTITNGGIAPAEQVAIITTFLDSSGAVTGYYRHLLVDGLAAGASLPFSFATTPPGGQTVSARFLAEGRQADDQ
jgi:LysM repeat protein